MKSFETFFTLCSPEDESQTGSGAYSDDTGEGENDTTDEEYDWSYWSDWFDILRLYY